MWAQRLQSSKPVIIALVVMILVFSFQASRPQAVGLDTAVKIAAGSNAQKLVRSIGEKAGMAFTPKSLQATTDYINGQAAKGNLKYVDLAKKVNTAASTGVPHATKPGWKKYILDPVLWLTGADLLVEAYDAFNDAKSGSTDIDVYNNDYDNAGFFCWISIEGVNQYALAGHTSTGKTSAFDSVRYYTTDGTMSCKIYIISETATEYILGFEVYINGSQKYGKQLTRAKNPQTTPGEMVLKRPVTDIDFPDITNVTNADTYRNTIDNDDYSRVTYDNDIEIYAPDETNITETDNYTTPWNSKMSDDEFTLIVQPIQDVDIIIPDDDDDLPTGPRPDPVETLDRSLLQVATEAYGYFDDAIDSSVASMRSVADGAGGIVDFLDDSMDWLPAEWRAVFTATFMLGVFAHFFRR